jgi:hypothetical protein
MENETMLSFCDSCQTVSGTHETGCPNAPIRPEWFSVVDDGTLDTVVAIGDVYCRFSEGFAAEYRYEDGELDLARFIRDNTQEMMDEAWNSLSDVLTQIQEWSEEYNTTHDDAGDGYAHMVAEGCWPDQWKRICEYLDENFDLTDAQLDKLADCGEEFCDDFEMRPGHIFSGEPGDGIVLDSWPVGEIEEQIEISHLAEQAKLPESLVRHLISEQSDFCLRMWRTDSATCEMYIYTDDIWQAVLTDERIEDILAETFGEEN